MSFVFSEVWNATFEGLPSDTENINLGAGRMRNLKVDIRQRMTIDHQWAGNNLDGKHLQVQLPPIGVPILDAGDGALFAANPFGPTELWYKDSAGNVVQLTSRGVVASPSTFPVNTRLAFSNPAPPPGWIQVMGGNDRVIRLVDDSSGQGAGGGWGITGISVSTVTSTVTGTTTSTTTNTNTSTGTSVSLSGGIVVLGHTLTTAEIPPLTFSSDYPTFTGTSNSSGSNPSSLITGTTTHSTNTIGSGGAHDHSVSNTLGASAVSSSSSTSNSSSTSTSSSSSFSSSTASQDAGWRPPYINFCLGQKS